MTKEELKSEIDTIIIDYKTYDEGIDDTTQKIMEKLRQRIRNDKDLI